MYTKPRHELYQARRAWFGTLVDPCLVLDSNLTTERTQCWWGRGSRVFEGLIVHCVQVQYRGAAGGELYGGGESAAGQSHLVHQPRAGMYHLKKIFFCLALEITFKAGQKIYLGHLGIY
jgi:hypothetical protein